MSSLKRRAAAVWVLLMAAEVAQGTVRTLWLAPVVGTMRSRQIGVLTGSCLILLIVWLTHRWIGFASDRQRIVTGVRWLIATLILEIGMGRIFGRSWVDLLADFNPAEGGLLAFGMILLAASPWLLRPRQDHMRNS